MKTLCPKPGKGSKIRPPRTPSRRHSASSWPQSLSSSCGLCPEDQRVLAHFVTHSFLVGWDATTAPSPEQQARGEAEAGATSPVAAVEMHTDEFAPSLWCRRATLLVLSWSVARDRHLLVLHPWPSRLCRLSPVNEHEREGTMWVEGQNGKAMTTNPSQVICGCVSFENGKRANPTCGMAKLRNPVFIVAESPFSRFGEVRPGARWWASGATAAGASHRAMPVGNHERVATALRAKKIW
jgi:hypothetical protein